MQNIPVFHALMEEGLLELVEQTSDSVSQQGVADGSAPASPPLLTWQPFRGGQVLRWSVALPVPTVSAAPMTVTFGTCERQPVYRLAEREGGKVECAATW